MTEKTASHWKPTISRLPGGRKVYLTLYKVTDNPFQTQGDKFPRQLKAMDNVFYKIVYNQGMCG